MATEDFWNERYKNNEYAYGESPNEYLKSKLSSLTPGKILFPADGEGRNSVFAASIGWEVDAFDLSKEGKNKALALADLRGVSLNYSVGDFSNLAYQPNEFDALALIFAHFPSDKKSDFHKKLTVYLKSGGVIIFEAFSKDHTRFNTLNPEVGGPRDLDTLFSIHEISSDFHDFHVLELYETEEELSEGVFHKGRGSVIRFLGIKK